MICIWKALNRFMIYLSCAMHAVNIAVQSWSVYSIKMHVYGRRALKKSQESYFSPYIMSIVGTRDFSETRTKAKTRGRIRENFQPTRVAQIWVRSNGPSELRRYYGVVDTLRGGTESGRVLRLRVYEKPRGFGLRRQRSLLLHDGGSQ